VRARQIIEAWAGAAWGVAEISRAMKTLLARVSPAVAKVGYEIFYDQGYHSIWIGYEPRKLAIYKLEIKPIYRDGCYTPENPRERPEAWRGMVSDVARVFQGDDIRAWIRPDLDELVELMSTRFVDMLGRRYTKGVNHPDMGEVVRHGFEDTEAYLELALSETKLMVGRVNAAFPRRRKLKVDRYIGSDLHVGQLFPGRIEVIEQFPSGRAERRASFGYLGFNYIVAEVFPTGTLPHIGQAISNTLPPVEQIYQAIGFVETGLMRIV
jgi:hypothetical protein